MPASENTQLSRVEMLTQQTTLSSIDTGSQLPFLQLIIYKISHWSEQFLPSHHIRCISADEYDSLHFLQYRTIKAQKQNINLAQEPINNYLPNDVQEIIMATTALENDIKKILLLEEATNSQLLEIDARFKTISDKISHLKMLNQELKILEQTLNYLKPGLELVVCYKRSTGKLISHIEETLTNMCMNVEETIRCQTGIRLL